MKKHRSQAGFTLIEMLLVLGIITLIVGGAAYYMGNISETAQLSRVDQDMTTYKSALKAYEVTTGSMPTTEQGLEALHSKPTTRPIPKRWVQSMEKIVQDPWKHPYQYRYPGKKNPGGYDLWSLGPDGEESEDDIGNWE